MLLYISALVAVITIILEFPLVTVAAWLTRRVSISMSRKRLLPLPRLKTGTQTKATSSLITCNKDNTYVEITSNGLQNFRYNGSDITVNNSLLKTSNLIFQLQKRNMVSSASRFTENLHRLRSCFLRQLHLKILG